MALRNIFSKLAAVAVAATLLSSCLDKEPQSAILQEEAMTTFSDAEQILTGIYSALSSGALYGGYLTLLPDIQADLVYAVDGYTNTYGDFWQWNILSTTEQVGSVYAALYTVIGRCNFYLDRVEEVRRQLTDDDLIETLDSYTGEVYCARALANSELIKCFCKAYDPETADSELGIVIQKSYSESQVARRSSLKESYEFVIEDLEKAEELLDMADDVHDAGYLTAAAVQALRARIALYMRDWETAVDYSSRLIDRSEYAVFSLADAKTQYTTDYTYFEYLWAYDLSFEDIFRITYTLTSYSTATGSVFLHFNTDYIYCYPDYVPAQWALNLYESNDLRYDTYFATVQTGYSHGLTWPLLVKYYGNRTFIANVIFHVSMPKPFRLAEQYLIRAEAYCNLAKPDYTKASADLTTLRKYRFSSGSGAISVNASNWLETISNERVRELYMEGFRLQDLKRWGQGFQRTPQSNSLDEGSSLKVEAGNPLFVWPIPNHELEAPGSEVQPNESNR